MGTVVWVCGKWTRDTDDGVVWELQGVFSSEELAAVACVHRDMFIGPAVLNEPLPLEKVAWPGSYFPLRKPDDDDYNNSRDEWEG